MFCEMIILPLKNKEVRGENIYLTMVKFIYHLASLVHDFQLLIFVKFWIRATLGEFMANFSLKASADSEFGINVVFFVGLVGEFQIGILFHIGELLCSFLVHLTSLVHTFSRSNLSLYPIGCIRLTKFPFWAMYEP